MKYLAALALLAALASNALAAGTCTTQATDKKLASAAMTSFMKKCEADATTACETESKTMKLAGAAMDAHTKK